MPAQPIKKPREIADEILNPYENHAGSLTHVPDGANGYTTVSKAFLYVLITDAINTDRAQHPTLKTEYNPDYKDVFGRHPEIWRTPLGALILTLAGEPVDIPRAREEVRRLALALEGTPEENVPDESVTYDLEAAVFPGTRDELDALSIRNVLSEATGIPPERIHLDHHPLDKEKP